MSKNVTTPIVALAAAVACVTMLSKFLKTKTEATRESSSSGDETGIIMHLIKKRRSIFPKQFSSSLKVMKEELLMILEAARWAPTHKLTEPWHFVIFESDGEKSRLGQYLAEDYKSSAGNEFLDTKYHKKIKNVQTSSFVIAICVMRANTTNKNPEVEDVSSVAMAVQNMSLVGATMNIGMYWSSGAIYEAETKKERCIQNPQKLKEFLKLPTDETICIGWLFIGKYDYDQVKKGVRKPLDDKIVWR